MEYSVAIVKYRRPEESVSEVIDLSGAFEKLQSGDKVFIKPNMFPWSNHLKMFPWTSLVVEDVVRELKNRGIRHITIGDGKIAHGPKDREALAYACETMDYQDLSERYGVKIADSFLQTPGKTKREDRSTPHVSESVLEYDFVISMPVLKTHTRTIVSLSQNNLIDCFSMMDESLDGHRFASKFSNLLPRSCTIIDGIYTLERGSEDNETTRRANILIASQDMLSADIAGAEMLGIYPWEVPHIVASCQIRGIEPTIDSVEIVGEPIDMWAKPHVECGLN